MVRRLFVAFSLTLALANLGQAQNANNTSVMTPTRQRSVVSKPAPVTKTSQAVPAQTPGTTIPRGQRTRTTTPPPVGTPSGVLAAFNALLEGIRHANVDAVVNSYWNSPRLILFNNNGSVTRGWEQMRGNRLSSYPDMKDVKLDVRDLRVLMLGRDGAVVSCLWTQSQIYRGVPETATGRMTIVFRRSGREWKAVHLHTSPDAPTPGRVMPSEQTPAPKPIP